MVYIKVSHTLPEDMLQEIQALCGTQNRSRSNMITQLLGEALKARRHKEVATEPD